MTGAELIAKERQRQIEQEGWTAEHDDAEHGEGDLACAGAVYALHAFGEINLDQFTEFWPFDFKWFKPTASDKVRQLTKAGALIAAEIDRLQRAGAKP